MNDVMGRLVGEKLSVTLRTDVYRSEKGRFLHPASTVRSPAWRSPGCRAPEDNLWAVALRLLGGL